MTRGQKFVVFLVALAVAAQLQFPPYEGVLLGEGDNVKRFIGFSHLNYPPNEPKEADWPLNMRSLSVGPYRYNPHVDLVRLTLHLLTTNVVGAALLILLGRTRG